MSLIFISHSSKDNVKAITVQHWLIQNGWSDIFLDLDPKAGILAGKTWRDEIARAIDRSDAMILLISRNWMASKECQRELAIACAPRSKTQLFAVLLEDIPESELDIDLQALQFLRLYNDNDYSHSVNGEVVSVSEQALEQLGHGLTSAGIAENSFIWPPVDQPSRSPYRGLAPLEAEDAGIFFGRDADIDKLLGKLATLRQENPPRFLAILGASGSGKSSFMRAGILPRLARQPSLYAPLPVIRPQQSIIYGQYGLINSVIQAIKQYDIVMIWLI